jgi:hypothetical protein
MEGPEDPRDSCLLAGPLGPIIEMGWAHPIIFLFNDNCLSTVPCGTGLVPRLPVYPIVSDRIRSYPIIDPEWSGK